MPLAARHLPLKYLANYTQINYYFYLNELYLELFKLILSKKEILLRSQNTYL
jgi:hypothetical protein